MGTGENYWETWRAKKQSKNLRPILDHYNDLVQKRVNMFSGAEVPRPALEIHAKKLVFDAVRTYDPSREASLRTHIYTHLQRLSRFTGEHQNIGRLPEHRKLNITKFKNTRNELEEGLKRMPSMQELAEKLIWPIKEVERMESELRATVVSSTFDADLVSATGVQSKEQRIIRNVYYELTPQEQTVYEYLVGLGRRQITETEIAKKLNMSTTRVSRIKHGIVKKIEKWI